MRSNINLAVNALWTNTANVWYGAKVGTCSPVAKLVFVSFDAASHEGSAVA
jgi:hypothetical protein